MADNESPISYADYKAGKAVCANKNCGRPIPPDEKRVHRERLTSTKGSGYAQDESTPWDATHQCDCGEWTVFSFQEG